jgi:HAD superfamily hydrolase (TIGR01509 family)
MSDASPGAELRAVMFDMDGLLVDTEPLWFEVEHAIMTRLGGQWSADDQRALIGGSLDRSVDYLIKRAARPASHDEVADWLIDGMAELLAAREVEALPGALELLGQVRAAGIPTALVTSSERVIMNAVLASLARHDIAFSVTVCGQDVHHPKPHPEPYLRAAALLGAEPACCIALEDSPNGVAAAEAAGCVTVAVPGLAPIGTRPGRTIAASLAHVDLDLLRSLVAAAAVTAAPPG